MQLLHTQSQNSRTVSSAALLCLSLIIYPQVSGLEVLLSSGAESDAAQTACFALSCLASKDDGHALLMESPSLPDLLDGLLDLLKSGGLDSTWFAAM